MNRESIFSDELQVFGAQLQGLPKSGYYYSRPVDIYRTPDLFKTARPTEPTSRRFFASLSSFYGGRLNSEKRHVPGIFLSRVGKCPKDLKMCTNKDNKYGVATTSTKYIVAQLGGNFEPIPLEQDPR